jgi:transcriptional regulator with XRE-family HTH domain
MPEFSLDLDRLAMYLKSKMDEEDLSVRAAAEAIGFGASTLSRLLQGRSNENVPDLDSINLAAKWVGKSLADLSVPSKQKPATIADVEVHLRALPGLAKPDVEALVAMVRATYKYAKKLRVEKR